MEFFLNETSILVFAELAIFHSVQTRTSLGKIVRKLLGKRYDVWCVLFGIYPHTSPTLKFWHMYMIMYGDFMVIVDSEIKNFWYLPSYVTYTKTLTHVHDHVQWFCGNCRQWNQKFQNFFTLELVRPLVTAFLC